MQSRQPVKCIWADDNFVVVPPSGLAEVAFPPVGRPRLRLENKETAWSEGIVSADKQLPDASVTPIQLYVLGGVEAEDRVVAVCRMLAFKKVLRFKNDV